MKIRYLVPFLIVTSMLFAQCSKRAIIRKYYILEMRPDAASAIDSLIVSYPLKVDVRNFNIAKAFDLTRIAVRTESNELNYYFYHHWAVRPSTAVSDVIYNVIERTGMFQRCSRGISLGPDYVIEGQIFALERIVSKGKEYAHLSGSIDLIDAHTELRAIKHEFDRLTDLSRDKSMNGYAVASSAILSEETALFITKLTEFLHNSDL